MESKNIVEQILNLVKNFSPLSAEDSGKIRIFSSIDGTYKLIDDYVVDYENLIDRLLNVEGWGKKFSEKYTIKIIDNLLVKAKEEPSPEKVKTSFDKIAEDFENFNEETVVYVALTGIKLFSPEFKIGPINLKAMNEEAIQQLCSKIDAVIMKTQNTADEKQSMVQLNHAKLNAFKGAVCSEYCVVAEPIRARERAEEETRRVLDVFRFAIPALYSPQLNVSVGLYGEVPFTNRFTPMVSEGKRFSLGHESIGPLCPFELSEENVEKMRAIGVFIVSDILIKNVRDLSEFELAIIRAIHWYSNSQVQAEGANRLLSLISCLETFLSPRDNDPIANSVAEGTALLIATGIDDRRKIKKKIKDLYRVRSRISHGGHKDVLEKDLRELSIIVGSLITLLIEKKSNFSSQKELLEWVEEKKLS